MSYRPVLFNAPMVRAVLAGTKSQTRRPVQPAHDEQINPVFFDGMWQWATLESRRTCPFGEPGDRLWVRETLQRYQDHIQYAADCTPMVAVKETGADLRGAALWPWAKPKWPSIHMPRWASRITLFVTDVRVQRLSEISDEDAIAEGIRQADPIIQFEDSIGWCYCESMVFPSPQEAFWDLWRVLYGMDSVRSNPWTWAVSFRRINA